MNDRLHRPGSRRSGPRRIGLWLSLLLGFLLAVIGLTSLNGGPPDARHLLGDTTVPAAALQRAGPAAGIDTSVPSADRVRFTPQDSDTTPVATF